MKKTVLVLITFALVIAVAGCGFWLVHYFIDSKEQRETYETLAEEFVLESPASVPPESSSPSPSPDEAGEEPGSSPVDTLDAPPRHDLAALAAENPDCVGWLTIPDTGIDYPVMHTPDDSEHYLRRDFYGESASGGTPFLDGRNAAQAEGQNLILYGHNMMDGSMFKPLISYLEPNFRETHKDIFLEIDGRQYHYEVLAVVETSVKSTLYTFTDLSDPAEESDFRAALLKETELEVVHQASGYLTLSTCNNGGREQPGAGYRGPCRGGVPVSRKKKKEEKREQLAIKDFFDRILPGVLKFYSDHYICGDSYRCVWAVKEYPPSTEEQAILRQLADRTHVTLRIYNRLVDHAEQHRIIQNANRRNRLRFGGGDIQEMVDAEHNLKDVKQLLTNLRTNGETLLHTAVFIELKAADMDKLRELQSDVMMELTRCKISVDRLTLRQLDGFLSVLPFGYNHFGSQYERVLPASSVANLYPFNYSGKTDPHGFYLGRDKFGTNILTDFDRRSDDKTNANVLILGNSGQGKSHLLKGILANLRESGKSLIVLDPEQEYQELCENLGGCYLDYLSGEYVINPLQPQNWDEDPVNEDDECTPEAFKKTTMLSRHISYLKDFFRSYKDFTTAQLDTIELMLQKLYRRFDMDDYTDFSQVAPEKFPTMSDFYDLLEEEFDLYDPKRKNLFSEETIQEVCLGLHSMCKGAESKYFNGHTNIKDDKFLVFGVKGIMELNRSLRDALLFSILSYMTNALLGAGNYVGALDELYLFLTNLTAIEYIRNLMKRDRKKDSLLVLASQNLEDFLQPGVRELTKPLFSIPTHQFLFNPGQLEPKAFCDTLQLEPAEFELIRYPERGTCLYRCGNERYLLQVHFPEFKEAMFGSAGGR